MLISRIALNIHKNASYYLQKNLNCANRMRSLVINLHKKQTYTNMTGKNLIEDYITVIKSDLKKMRAIVDEVEKKILEDSTKVILEADNHTSIAPSIPIPTPTPTPSITYTPTENTYVRTSFKEKFDSEKARCAIPIAMVLTSSIEFIGSLLSEHEIWNSPKKFEISISTFFEYADNPLTDNEIDLFRAIYRNGMMHGFFPQGSEIAINYDSHYQDLPLFFLNTNINCIELNGIKLHEIVKGVYSKIIDDMSIHSRIEEQFHNYSEYVFNKTHSITNSYKNSNPVTYP